MYSRYLRIYQLKLYLKDLYSLISFEQATTSTAKVKEKFSYLLASSIVKLNCIYFKLIFFLHCHTLLVLLKTHFLLRSHEKSQSHLLDGCKIYNYKVCKKKKKKSYPLGLVVCLYHTVSFLLHFLLHRLLLEVTGYEA